MTTHLFLRSCAAIRQLPFIRDRFEARGVNVYPRVNRKRSDGGRWGCEPCTFGLVLACFKAEISVPGNRWRCSVGDVILETELMVIGNFRVRFADLAESALCHRLTSSETGTLPAA